MASCPKCGKHLKRKKGKAKCSSCGPLPEITINGRKPGNPFGSCFDAAAHNLLGNFNSGVGNMMMCHAIGISNYPGIEGQRVAHAWIEFDHPQGRCAFDPIWLLAQPAGKYREAFKVELVIEYTKEEFMELWRKHDYPGPWDDRIKSITERKAA